MWAGAAGETFAAQSRAGRRARRRVTVACSLGGLRAGARPAVGAVVERLNELGRPAVTAGRRQAAGLPEPPEQDVGQATTVHDE